jgi:hypothetical protein
MRKQILAGAMALALVAGVTSSAMAFDQSPRSSSHAGRVRAGGMYAVGARHSSRYEGVRGFEAWRHGSWNHHGGYTDLGPLGVRLGDYPPGGGYGSSIAAWSR